MATSNIIPTPRPFLALPASIRQRIYQHLLAPHPKETVTTINYTLNWPWLENPSNTTFAGDEQVDLCRCPQQQYREYNVPTEDHIYTRLRCHGPEIKVKSAREKLWVVSAEYGRSGGLNFLRPATKIERKRRPHANILSTCKTIYQEAVPILYRDRTLQLVTGPCPRGRYQAYATQMFLMRLTPLARAHVTAISIIAQRYEEDACMKDTGKAYFHLAAFLADCLPSFQKLHLDIWDEKFSAVAGIFCGVYGKEGASIRLDMDPQNGNAVDYNDLQSYRMALRGDFPAVERDNEPPKRAAGELVRKDSINRTCLLERKASIRSRKSSRASQTELTWKEVTVEEETLNHEQRITEPNSPSVDSRKRHNWRRASRIQRLSAKLQVKAKTKTKTKEEVRKEMVEDDFEWVDTVSSSSSTESGRDKDEESWEVL